MSKVFPLSERPVVCVRPTPSAAQTSQLPPKPMVTLPASTMTGIWRRPLEYLSMRSRPESCSKTLMYSKGILRREKSSRAPEV